MNLNQIESKIQNLVKFHNPFEFIFEFLAAYNIPKATVTRLKKGNSNLSKQQGEVILKKKLFFREELMMDLHETISLIENYHKHRERFLIVTDWKTFLAIDTKTKDKLDTEFKDLPKHYDFFLPWAGMEKTQHVNDNPADVKAAEKMAKLFDAIKQNNPDDSEEFVHSLNVFLSRLLFCFFAEDTNIFEENQFTNAISSHTQPDGSDLDDYLDKLFEVLNTPPGKRENLPTYLDAFPYVNGGLFKDKLKMPKFNRKARQSIIDSGELNWSDINPDIFGSMFQAVIDVDQRGSLGQHYTSVPNIMKVIEPLFLNELNEEFENAKGNKRKLVELLERLKNIKIFDPACGSGNFLIIAYKELRRLEINVLEELKQIKGDAGTVSLDFGADYLSHISLNNFFGIEYDDFAHEIAKLALWLAEHQMNQEFFKAIGKSNPTLPLKDAGQIHNSNACRTGWDTICVKTTEDEVYLIGNPPYVGAHLQSKEQKEDIEAVFKGYKGVKKLDYISCWFYKGSQFIKGTNSKMAFVSTNSICQGEQVAILWPKVLKDGTEIFFAHKSFLWTNNAKGKAAVYCVIVGVSANPVKKKWLFADSLISEVKNISPYLINASNTIIESRTTSLSRLPKMMRGSSPVDGGNLILNTEEKNKLLLEEPKASKFIKRLVGADDYLNGKMRWCLWIEDSELKEALAINEIKRRVEAVRNFRLSSKKKATQKASDTPHAFFERKHQAGTSIIVPRVTSERRKYLQCGFLNEKSVVLDRAQVVYTDEIYVVGLLSSKFHHVWTSVVSGRLKMDINYSVSLCYNNFPFPKISNSFKDEITKAVIRIIEVREKYSEKTLAELYDPDKMPPELLEAHELNDAAVERCYRVTPFPNDEERLEYLFRLYEKMIAEEMNATTLFAKQKKPRKKT